MQIEDYLYQKYLHESLLGVKPDTMTTKQLKLKNCQAPRLIWLTLSRNVAFNIIKEKKTSDQLKVLLNMYEKSSIMNKVYLMRKLFNCTRRKMSLSDNCTRRKRKHNRKSEDDDDSINLAEDIGDSLILSVDSLIESWILDSGASFHSSPNKELFRNLKSRNFEKVYLATTKILRLKKKRMST